jgi:hypothetical protein
MTTILTRRAALLSFAVLSAAALSGCNTLTAPAPSATSAGVRIRSIEVDTSPLLAESGDPTAGWAQQALTQQLAQAFASASAPGDPTGATLRVTVDAIYLGLGGTTNPDVIKGSATLTGAGVSRHTNLSAAAVYIPLTIDQALPEQALQGRVTALTQVFSYWVKTRMQP